MYAGWLLPSTPIFFSFPSLLTSFPAERLCQVESIKTVHLSETRLFEGVCCCRWFHNCAFSFFVSMCEFVVFSNVRVWMWVCICMCVQMSEWAQRRGLPWGLAVWRCSAAHSSCENASDGTGTAVASLYRFMGHNKPNDILTNAHILTYYYNPCSLVWLSVFVLSVCQELSVCLYLIQCTWENSPYFPFFPVQVPLPDICGGTPFSLFSFIQPTLCASHAAMDGFSECVEGVTF